MLRAELSSINDRLRDLAWDHSLPQRKHQLYVEFYRHQSDILQVQLALLIQKGKVRSCEAELAQKKESLNFAKSDARNPQEDKINEASNQCAKAEASLNSALAELQTTSSASERLRMNDAHWEQRRAEVRQYEFSRRWESITPEELQPAARAIHDAFGHAGWRYEQSTKKLCYAALHPAPEHADPVGLEDLDPYRNVLVALFGPRMQTWSSETDQTPSFIFRSYLDAYESALTLLIRAVFQDFLEIALAQAGILSAHPVEWAKRHLQILISSEKGSVIRWIREVCDKQDLSKVAETEEDLDAQLFWVSWRAPRFIHMKPAGNMPYDAATAWTREDQDTSERFLEGRAERFITFLKIHLDKVTGTAHIRYAKLDKPTPRVSREEPAQKVSEAFIPPIPGKRTTRPKPPCFESAIEQLTKNPQLSLVAFCRLMDSKANQYQTSQKYRPPKSWEVRTFMEQYKKRSNTVSRFLSDVRKAMNSEGD